MCAIACRREGQQNWSNFPPKRHLGNNTAAMSYGEHLFPRQMLLGLIAGKDRNGRGSRRLAVRQTNATEDSGCFEAEVPSCLDTLSRLAALRCSRSHTNRARRGKTLWKGGGEVKLQYCASHLQEAETGQQKTCPVPRLDALY